MNKFIAVLALGVCFSGVYAKAPNKDKKEDQQKQQQKQSQQNEENMSKENAEQLLNAAMQDEKDTQERIRKAMAKPRQRKLEKQW